MLALVLSGILTAASPAIGWQGWGPAPFDVAHREHKLILLEVEAVWCHWCHVQDATTYQDPRVIAAVRRSFVAVKVDQDADPALSERYARWGWPAIVVLTADGQQVAVHRGYAEPAEMLAFLQKAAADPHPHAAVEIAPEPPSDGGLLSGEQRDELMRRDLDEYDASRGGWGDGHKMLDADELELALVLAERGDEGQARMVQQTLEAARGLVDPVWGGVAQYSATPDWQSPHFEHLLTVQADALSLYSRAYALTGEAADRATAARVLGFVGAFLTEPDGALDVSQDADLSARVDGVHYYALEEAERRRLGIPPVDHHAYARQSGLGALGLLAFADATGDASALDRARRAVAWVQAREAVAGGGFRHDEASGTSLALADTLAMGRALLALYATTGERPYLDAAEQAASFIASHFATTDHVGFAAETGGPRLLATPFLSEEDNAALARWANLLFQYTGEPAHRAMAEQAMRYLALPSTIGDHGLRGEILLADRELASSPLHVTVVGPKDDPVAAALFREARRTPVTYLRTDWLDPHGPPMPNLDVTFPPMSKPAAFVCDGNTCSLPMMTPERLRQELRRRR